METFLNNGRGETDVGFVWVQYVSMCLWNGDYSI